MDSLFDSNRNADPFASFIPAGDSFVINSDSGTFSGGESGSF